MQVSLIATSDAAAMFRRQVGPNDPPYTKINKEENNKLVDEWKAKLLDKVAKDGKLRAEGVASLWNLFVTGREVHRIIANAGVETLEEALPPAADEKELEELREFFETADSKTLHGRGRFDVKRGWDKLMYHFNRHQLLVLYDKVYEGTTDPQTWYTRHLAGRNLFAEPIIPFWTFELCKQITERVMIFLTWRSGPS